MRLVHFLFGRPLRSDEEDAERIGVLSGVPVLGLDALASSSYGPEAALTVLLPIGGAALGVVGPITCAVIGVLALVASSYGQTMRAYPEGGGSFTVAKQNLGEKAGLLAATALCIDYALNVAVAISAGVAAAASVAPPLLAWTLPLCLAVLVALTVINLRGVREAGLVFVLPTYLFVGCLVAIIGLGVWKTVVAHGHPRPVAPTRTLPGVAQAASLWIVARAFASGCTALTGVEAVSNAVPIFRKPKVARARCTLAVIVLVLMILLAGIAVLARAYGIGARKPGEPGYESVISQVVAAVAGRGAFYYVTMGSVFAVLALSANTSFADFPRVCRLLALDDYLPEAFARRGRRLVYSAGIVTLCLLAGILLVAFHGITDRLIPLFAVGAFLAFALSQLGMIVHWKRQGNVRAMSVNLLGCVATFATLAVIVVSKFAEGAWITIVVIPVLLVGFSRVRRASRRVCAERLDPAPLEVTTLPRPIVVLPADRLDRVARKGLRMALSLADDVRVVQVVGDDTKCDDLTRSWKERVEEPARAAGLPVPKLVVLPSAYRQFFAPLLEYLRDLSVAEPDRPIAVLVPELVRRRWYHFFVRSRATLLKALLLFKGGPRISVINTPWYLSDEMDGAVSRPLRTPP